MLDLGTLYAKVQVDAGDGISTLQSFGNEVNNVETKTVSLGGVVKGVLTSAAVVGTLKAIGDGLVSCYNSASEFETGFAKVSTLLDESTTDFEAYKDSIIDASNETGVAVGELSESVYGSISAGIDAADAVKFTTEAVKLAKGGFTDTASAVDVMTTAINGYKLSADDATKISDLLITTQNLGKTTVDELSSSMGKVIPIASSANFSIEELSASYATLTKNGIATAEAGTYMKAMLNELSKSGSTADKALRELTGKGFAELKAEGQSTTDILKMLSDTAQKNNMSLKDMFSSTEAGSAALVLMSQNGAEYNEILAQMQDSAGATGEAFAKMAQTPEEQMALLKNQLKNIGIEVGEKLLPIVSNLVSWVSEHLPEIEDAVNSVMLVIQPVVEAIIGFIGSIINAISKLVEETQKDGTLLNTIWENIKVVIETVLNTIANIFNIFSAAFNGDWSACWEGVKKLFSDIWDGIKKIFSNTLDAIKGLITGAVNGFKSAVTNLMNAVKTAFTNKWDEIKKWFSDALNKLKSIITDKVNDFKEAGRKILTAVWDGLKSVWSDISNWVSNKVKWLSDKLAFWRDGQNEMGADGSHRNGLTEVPFDGYKAILHKGEMVLTQPEADRYRKGISSNSYSDRNNVTQTNVNVTFEGDLSALGRVLYPVIKKEETRKGTSLLGGVTA